MQKKRLTLYRRKAEPEHVTKICDLKAELEAKREEGFSESADTEEEMTMNLLTVNFSNKLNIKMLKTCQFRQVFLHF